MKEDDANAETVDIEAVKGQISDQSTEKENFHSDDETTSEEQNLCSEPRLEVKGQETVDLFKIVFEAAQKPDKDNKELQSVLTYVLIGAVCVQVVWAMWFISYVVMARSDLSANMLQFVSLLVTAVLAEVVAMGFFMVKFVFRTPIDMMLDLLKEIIKKR